MDHQVNILLLNPFHSGSHAQWANSLCQNWGEINDLQITACTLPGRHWKWRMHGASAEFARQCALEKTTPKAIICTDMMDVATFKGLLRRDWCHVPIIQYFHENQVTYPWSPNDPDAHSGRDRTYGMMNILSAMAADALWFNSNFHRQAFINAIPSFIHPMPDQLRSFIEHPFEQKSSVLPIGIECPLEIDLTRPCTKAPTILWNHRWEFDKAPEFLFEVLKDFKTHEIDFSLILTGPQFDAKSHALDLHLKHFETNIIHQGYAESRSDYLGLLRKSDFVIHSPKQEYFGISVLEAMAHGVIPILGKGNAYDDWCPEKFLINDIEMARERFQNLSQEPALHRKEARGIAEHFEWKHVIQSYHAALSSVLESVRSV